MGTAVAIHLEAEDAGHPAIEEAMSHLRWVEETFSTFLPTSQISRLARGGLEIGNADERVREVLDECDRLRRVTGGAFDHLAGDALDPAGYVKGWAVDGAAGKLRAAGVENFMIWAGGDVLTAGHPADTPSWCIGIQNPREPTLAVDTVELVDCAVATSARYARGDHIWGAGSTGLSSVSVIGPRLGLADALATAVLAAGLDKIDWFRRFPHYEFIAVSEDHRILRSSPRRDAETAEIVLGWG